MMSFPTLLGLILRQSKGGFLRCTIGEEGV
nr:MAG TPA: hypothetical protein [Caudoviricetes sp.]